MQQAQYSDSSRMYYPLPTSPISYEQPRDTDSPSSMTTYHPNDSFTYPNLPADYTDNDNYGYNSYNSSPAGYYYKPSPLGYTNTYPDQYSAWYSAENVSSYVAPANNYCASTIATSTSSPNSSTTSTVSNAYESYSLSNSVYQVNFCT